jgi:hypothetical protein
MAPAPSVTRSVIRLSGRAVICYLFSFRRQAIYRHGFSATTGDCSVGTALMHTRVRGQMRKMKTGWICSVLLLVLNTSPASAQDVTKPPLKPSFPTVTVPDYVAAKRDGAGWNAMRAYLKGVGDGLLAGNVDLQHYKQPMHFCPPDNVQLNEYDYVEILDRMLKDSPNYNRPGNPIAVLLTIGLRRSFPCR